jgi:uncharacterized protein involved in outer membrane biogenesis
MKWMLAVAVVLIVVAVVAVYVIVSSYDYNKLKPVVADAVVDATGRELTMAGDIKLGIGLRPALVVENVSFQNSPWGSRPEMVAVKRFEVQVALLPLIGGNIEIRRLILIEPDILIETDATGNSNLDFEKPAEAEKPEEGEPDEGELELPELAFHKVRIEDGRLAYKDGKSNRTYTVALESLNAVSAGKAGSISINLQGAYNAKPFEVEGTVGPITQLTDSQKPWPIKLAVRAGATVVGLDGAIKDAMNARGLDLNLTAESESIAEMAGLADVSGVPDLGPFRGSANVSDPAAKMYRVSGLQIKLGENDLAGSLEIALASKRPSVKAALSSQNIDVRPILEKGEQVGGADGAKTEPASKRDRVFPDEALPLDSMTLVDVQASIQAEHVLLPRLALNDLTADMTLVDGVLTVKPIKAVVGGGSLDGRMVLNSKGGAADLDVGLEVQQLDIGRMLSELDITDVIEGDIDAEIKLDGRGKSIAGLMAGLNGKTVVVMGNGRINNEYIDLLGADIRSDFFRLLNPLEEKKSYTELNCFVSRFDINDGLAESTALVLDTSGLSVIGDGRINLKTEALNLSLKPSPKKGLGTGDTGKITLSLGELVKPFKLGGTLAKPRLAIDPTQSAIALGKAYGGVALFGPVGIAAALASGGSGDENPCLAAIEAAKTGVKAADVEKATGEQGTPDQTTGDVTEGTKQTIEGAGQTLKKLFGR